MPLTTTIQPGTLILVEYCYYIPCYKGCDPYTDESVSKYCFRASVPDKTPALFLGEEERYNEVGRFKTPFLKLLINEEVLFFESRYFKFSICENIGQ
ncbi:MAG: hypothetical protein WC761_01035 [Candidatus Paceibacterota bacterium]|jgi:hypothetical protein